jgi:hypothetical protein
LKLVEAAEHVAELNDSESQDLLALAGRHIFTNLLRL